MKKKTLFTIIIAATLVAVLCLSLAACNTDKVYKVTFSGEGVSIPAQSVKEGETALEPAAPTREDWTFDGWYLGEEKFDFATPINKDIELVAKWTKSAPTVPTSMTGAGTKEDPYVLWTVNDLLNFSTRVNTPADEGNEGFYKAYFKLGQDIDMSAVNNFTPVGKAVTIEDGGEVKVRGFEGVFDGGGHKIIGLKIASNLRSGISKVGFFGTTYMATISNLTLENISYNAEAAADVDTIGVYLGGVVGQAYLTTFLNVKVNGDIKLAVFASNGAEVGGIAGEWNLDSNNPVYGYAENCFADVNIVKGTFSDDSLTDLAAMRAGGIFGVVTNYNSAAAIINCASSGRIDGGVISGGIAGYLYSAMTSVINCASNMTVKVSATDESTYAGGLVGAAFYDVLIADSVFYGSVTGSRPEGTASLGYTGAILGFGTADEYDMYYEAGAAVVNCWHKASVKGGNKVSNFGTALASAPNKAWAVTALGFIDACWTENEGTLVPTSVLAADVNKEVSLVLSDGDNSKTVTKEVEGAAMYPIVGLLDDGANDTNSAMLFYDWQLTDGAYYRYYMPLFKDVTLTARRADVKDIVGVYTGVAAVYSEQRDAGIIQLREDGGMQWIQGSSTGGTYKFDGLHVILELNSSKGTVCGNIADGVMRFDIEEGMSAVVAYTFTKSELKYFGDYYSEEGDLITFSGGNTLYLNSPKVGAQSVKGTFTEDGNTLTVTGGQLIDYFSAMTITLGADLSLDVSFTGKSGRPDIIGAFSKLGTPDYSGREFLGTYCFAFMPGSEPFYPTYYQVSFEADGTLIYNSAYSSTKGSYYAFGNTVRFTLEGNTSTFTYDAELDVLHGMFNRGIGVVRNTVMPKVSDGAAVGKEGFLPFVIDDNGNNVVFVFGNKTYYMKDGVLDKTSEVAGSFEHDGVVTIDGVRYLVQVEAYSSYPTYTLAAIGEEAGDYTFGGHTYKLNGIGGVGGDFKGDYFVHDGKITLFLFNDTVDDLFVFDYAAAKLAGGAITKLEGDGYQSIWYVKRTDKDTGVTNDKYYKIYLDGFGHATAIYYSEMYECYRFMWAGYNNGWGVYSSNEMGVVLQFNESQKAELSFYYDNMLAHSRQFGSQGELFLYKEGYDGAMALPTLPANALGSYSGSNAAGTSVVLNLRADLTGSYKGVAFIAIYDGLNTVKFRLNEEYYTFDLTTKVISGDGEEITLTLGGAVTEVIPASLCGEWRGELNNMGNAVNGVITLNTEGTLVYGGNSFTAQYDIDKNEVTATGSVGGEMYNFKLTYNAADDTFDVYVNYSSENRTITGTVSR